MGWSAPNPSSLLTSRTIQREVESFLHSLLLQPEVGRPERVAGPMLALKGVCVKDGLGGKPALVSLGPTPTSNTISFPASSKHTQKNKSFPIK